MEELAKAITELIRTGAPLGELAIRWYFFVQILETAVTVLTVFSVLGTACFIVTRSFHYLRWLRAREFESAEKAGRAYKAL